MQFFQTENWNPDAEKELLIKIQELLALSRDRCKSLEVKVHIQVSSMDEILFMLKKKLSHRVEINQQKLSIREIQVLGLIMQGLTNHEIAEKLFVSYETVKSHRKNILSKTHAKNTAALINYYHQTFFEK
ncbi:MAG: helix-turn-helix transcriptional regulator [Chryseosolibacter sp.]